MRILLVEDDPDMRALLRTVWEKVPGATEFEEVATVWDARLAVSRRRPGLVVLDWLIPGGDSFELLQELAGQGMAVFLTSASAPPAQGYPPEARGWLPKPTWSSIPEAIRVATAAMNTV